MHCPERYLQHTSVIWTIWLNGLRFVYKQSSCEIESRCSHLVFRYGGCFKQRISWHSHYHRLWIHSETYTWHDKNIQTNAPYRWLVTTHLNIWPVWLNGWVFVYEISGRRFESCYSHLISSYGTYFEQRVPWHSGKYKMWVHPETRTWHDTNIQPNAPYR